MANKVKLCQGKDQFERMNFLYQASNMMAGRNDTLSCYYGHLCKTVAKKAVLRMEPNVKRTICKKCGIILKPGITGEISIDPKNRKIIQIKCLKCGCIKRFTINSNYDLWLDNVESVKESIRFQNGSIVIDDAEKKILDYRHSKTDKLENNDNGKD